MKMKYAQAAILLALLLTITQANCVDIECYVCDDCAKVDSNTLKVTCNESYVERDTTAVTSTDGTTIPVTMTTEMPATMPTTTTTTTTMETTSPMATSTLETTVPTTTSSLPPTPPLETTTSFPTPPTEGALPVLPQLARVARQAPQSAFSYHCYSIHHMLNGKNVVKRGCARNPVNMTTCDVVEENNPGSKDCMPCSTSLCNGSNTLNVSLITLLVAAVAGLLHYH